MSVALSIIKEITVQHSPPDQLRFAEQRIEVIWWFYIPELKADKVLHISTKAPSRMRMGPLYLINPLNIWRFWREYEHRSRTLSGKQNGTTPLQNAKDFLQRYRIILNNPNLSPLQALQDKIIWYLTFSSSFFIHIS